MSGAEAWMPNHRGRQKQVVDEGILKGQVIGVSFLLVRFLWTSKENEPACRRNRCKKKFKCQILKGVKRDN